jgi:6-phosphogluconolactonase (cycloisomerase 2 family)
MLELVSAVSHCKLDPATGELKEVAILPLLPSGELGETRAHHRGGGGIVASPSGDFIYATLRNTVPGVVVALKRDPETGMLKVHKRASSGGEIPRCLVCVGEDLIMVANQEDRKVCCLKGKGDLTLLAEVGGFDCGVAFVGELR